MDDVLFGLIEEAIRRIEPTVMSFEKEVEILKNLANSLSHQEKSDFVRRGHCAKQMMSFY
jgi:hypothetical protein